MIEERDLRDFHELLMGQVESVSDEPAKTQSDWNARLAEVVLGYMEECGYADEPNLCPHEDTSGRNRTRITAYGFRDENKTLELYTTAFVGGAEIVPLPAAEIRKLTGRAARFFDQIVKGDLERFEDNPLTYSAAVMIQDNLGAIDLVRVHLLTNGLAEGVHVDTIEINGCDVEFSIMDVGRLFRTAGRPSSREDIDVDLKQILGHPLPVLEVLPSPEQYDTYLAIFSGELVYRLYETYGPRLLEFNVRSFLQARGKVNRGIRDTLRNQPDRFLAYNNGLTATVDGIDVGMHHGQACINRLRGLQIVNGGQTVASIHRAKKQEKTDISRVSVAVKITRVEEDCLNEIVPLISQFSNTQNVIQVADLSANHPFHIAVERLSETVWCPGEHERWTYERTRGAYQVSMLRIGTTTKRLKNFKLRQPASKKFTKTDLAKYLMTWLGRPHDVSRGAQKVFSIFMSELGEILPESEFQVDDDFYKNIVAKGIVFKSALSIVRQEKFPAYRANIVAYLVAYLAHRFGSQIDLSLIWNEQELSDELKSLLRDWAHEISSCIIETAHGRNVTEWAKKSECWSQVRELDLNGPESTLPELVHNSEVSREEATRCSEVEVGVARCEAVSAEEWVRIVTWGRTNGRLREIEWKVAKTMADYAMEGWPRTPSPKQIRHATRALDLAAADGVL